MQQTEFQQDINDVIILKTFADFIHGNESLIYSHYNPVDYSSYNIP